MTTLTNKQQRFVEEYLIDLNATQAATRAGYSKNRSSEIAYQLLQKTTVQDELSRLMTERAKRTELKADEVLLELKKIAFSNMGDFLCISDDGSVSLDFSKISQGDLAAVTKFTQKHISRQNGPDIIETKFELASKVTALIKLGEHLGLFKQKVELSVDDGLAMLLKELDGKSRGLPNEENNAKPH